MFSSGQLSYQNGQLVGCAPTAIAGHEIAPCRLSDHQ